MRLATIHDLEPFMTLVKLGNATVVLEHVVAVEKRGLESDWILHLSSGRHIDCAAKD
jgi:hypothetical protein